MRLHWCSLTLLLPAMFLAGTGIVLFSFIETEHNYAVSKVLIGMPRLGASAFHTLRMTKIFFLYECCVA